MPEYTYTCEACGHTEKQWRHIYTDANFDCPKCPKCEIPMIRQWINDGVGF